MLHGRLEWLRPNDLSPQQRDLYDAILSGPRGSAARAFPMTDDEGRFHGPFNAMLVDPVVGDAAQRLGAAIRYGTALDARAREIAILELAALQRSDFEWYAHAAVGRLAGLTDAELRALQLGHDEVGFTASEQMTRRVVRALVTSADLDDSEYQAAVEVLGEVAVVDLVVLVGFYEYTALALRVFRVPLPKDAPATFG